jgi:hypothetical protein
VRNNPEVNAVISLCDKSGVMVRPWAEAGYECWCVDTQHSIRRDRTEKVGAGVIHYVWGDCRSWRLPSDVAGRVMIGFAFTPCTHLNSSGARDHKKKGGWMLADAVQLFDSAEVAFTYGGFPYMMENPIGRLSTHRREPDHKFQPWMYGDLYFKQTCLWTGNGFVMPAPMFSKPPEGTTEKIWLMPPGEERQDERSQTPPGFAQAVFRANHREITRQAAKAGDIQDVGGLLV